MLYFNLWASNPNHFVVWCKVHSLAHRFKMYARLRCQRGAKKHQKDQPIRLKQQSKPNSTFLLLWIPIVLIDRCKRLHFNCRVRKNLNAWEFVSTLSSTVLIFREIALHSTAHTRTHIPSLIGCNHHFSFRSYQKRFILRCVLRHDCAAKFTRAHTQTPK